jgi:hypothetical protein
MRISRRAAAAIGFVAILILPAVGVGVAVLSYLKPQTPPALPVTVTLIAMQPPSPIREPAKSVEVKSDPGAARSRPIVSASMKSHQRVRASYSATDRDATAAMGAVTNTSGIVTNGQRGDNYKDYRQDN